MEMPKHHNTTGNVCTCSSSIPNKGYCLAVDPEVALLIVYLSVSQHTTAKSCE